MALKIDLRRPASVQQELRRQFKLAMDDALLDLAEYLERKSPVGVSRPRQSLKGNWDITPARKVRGWIPEVLGSVDNKALASEYRVRGRKKGRFPPYGEDTPLGKWAAAKGIPAFVVARAIATKGTKRYQKGAGGNILKQDPKTLRYHRNSPIYTVFESTLGRGFARMRV